MDTTLLLIYFVYGLAFWAMGLAVLLESGRSASPAQARSLHWLSAFGMTHGTHEWLDAYLLAAGSAGIAAPTWLAWFRLGLLVVSFTFLFAYALSVLQQSPPERKAWYGLCGAPLAAALAILVGAAGADAHLRLDWIPLLDAASRYALAAPSAALAHTASWAAARRERAQNHPVIASNLRWAALAFAGYAIAQLFVHQLPWFPANLINQEAFRAWTGLPIQALRAVMAALIAFGLLRAMQAAERDRQVQLHAAHAARLAAVEQQDALRRDLLRHVVRTQEDERARIARELHDEIAQLLSAFTLHLGALRLRIRKPETLELVDRLQGLAHQMSDSLYRLVGNLRPSHLDNLGLVPALEFLLSKDYGPKGLAVGFHVTGKARPLPGLIDTALFRVAQESLANVVRHAEVRQAEVDLLYEGDRVTLRICDQGRGFDPVRPFKPPQGWGLAGMRERVEALGGRLSLRSGPMQGTTVEAVIPLESEPREESIHE